MWHNIYLGRPCICGAFGAEEWLCTWLSRGDRAEPASLAAGLLLWASSFIHLMIGLETLFDIPGPHFPEARTLFASFSSLKCDTEKNYLSGMWQGWHPRVARTDDVLWVLLEAKLSWAATGVLRRDPEMRIGLQRKENDPLFLTELRWFLTTCLAASWADTAPQIATSMWGPFQPSSPPAGADSPDTFLLLWCCLAGPGLLHGVHIITSCWSWGPALLCLFINWLSLK